MFTRQSLAVLIFIVSLLSACATGGKSKPELLDNTIRGYSQALRWEAPERLTAFFDPNVDLENQRQNMQHFAQFNVKGVRPVGPPTIDKETDTATQQVVIELINRHTLTPKSIMDVQRWRFENGRWLLTSGYPDMKREVETN